MGKVFAGDEYEQAKLIFAKIRNLVEAAGGTMADVVKVTSSSPTSRSAKKFGGRAARSSWAIFPQAHWSKWRRWPSRR